MSKACPEIFLVVVVAKLGERLRIYGHAGIINIGIVIGNNGLERIIQQPQGTEEQPASLVAFRLGENICRDIMGKVINPIQNRNLSFVSFHFNIFSVYNQYSAELTVVFSCYVG